MKSILIKLGYNGEVYDYATKKTCGIWFAIIGVVIIVSSLLGYDLCVNPITFVVGYGIGFYLCYGNKKIIFNRLASSQPSCFQEKMSNIALGSLALFCALFGSFCWLTHQNMRNIWLSLFIATALHFFVFYFVHGKSVVVLGILCLAYSVIGLLLANIPFLYIAVLDGITKIIIGVAMIFQKRGNNKNTFYCKLF